MRRARTVHPASAAEIERRIRQMLGLLPMSRDELREQVCIHAEDGVMFEKILRALRSAGAVIRDSHRAWLRAAPRTIV
jgi:hypothetical protein